MRPFYFSSNGTVGTTLSWLASAPIDNRKRHRGTYLNATSDLAGSAVTSYSAGPAVLVTVASASGQATVTAPGTGNFAASDIVLIYSGGVFNRAIVSSVTATTVVLTTSLTVSLVPGDCLIKRGAVIAAFPVGAATKEIVASAGFTLGDIGRAFWLELTGTSACKINAVAGDYPDA